MEATLQADTMLPAQLKVERGGVYTKTLMTRGYRDTTAKTTIYRDDRFAYIIRLKSGIPCFDCNLHDG